MYTTVFPNDWKASAVVGDPPPDNSHIQGARCEKGKSSVLCRGQRQLQKDGEWVGGRGGGGVVVVGGWMGAWEGAREGGKAVNVVAEAPEVVFRERVPKS